MFRSSIAGRQDSPPATAARGFPRSLQHRSCSSGEPSRRGHVCAGGLSPPTTEATPSHYKYSPGAPQEVLMPVFLTWLELGISASHFRPLPCSLDTKDTFWVPPHLIDQHPAQLKLP